MYLTFSQPGIFLGLTGHRLVVYKEKSILKEFPLKLIKFITIESRGISFSTDLAMQCALRGIQIFIMNYKGQAVSALYGFNHHATSRIREKQFEYLRTSQSIHLSKDIITAKIKNQRSILLYFGKYFNKSENTNYYQEIRKSASELKGVIGNIENKCFEKKESLLGYEGIAARIYWSTLKKCSMISESFSKREGRGATEINNQMLNYGYAILSGHIWRALQNTGLELFAGFLHEARPGKPSLVLDVMEVYRAWVVDRVVVKQNGISSIFDNKCKKAISSDIHETFQRRYRYEGKKVKLEAILQRQMFKLAGRFAGNRKYRPYIFRW